MVMADHKIIDGLTEAVAYARGEKAGARVRTVHVTPEQLAKSGTEHGEQSAFFCWCASSGIPELRWCFAIPNGFYATPAQKAKMKAEGLRSGVWDVFLPASSPDYYCGLFIEFKQEKYRNHAAGGLTDKQIEFRKDLELEYVFAVCYNWMEAREAVLKYLGEGGGYREHLIMVTT